MKRKVPAEIDLTGLNDFFGSARKNMKVVEPSKSSNDIIRMAREAGLFHHVPPTGHVSFIYDLMEFTALVAATVAPVCGECGKSAPDLLTALEKCEALALSDNDPEDLLEEVRIAAHAAIALAKGKA